MKTYNINRLFVRNWKVQNPKAIIQVIHGMAEHSLRYDEFAKHFNNLGIEIYSSDNKGHGLTCVEPKKLGLLSKDGLYEIVEDNIKLNRRIRREHPNVPIFLLGHSMGSFIAQECIKRRDFKLSGVLLSGGGFPSKVELFFARILAKMKFSNSKPSEFIDSLIFGSSNKYFKDEKDKYSWLSSDKEVRREYADDIYCGFLPPSSFYYYFFDFLLGLNDSKEIERVNIPIFIFSGEMDPVGDYSKGVKKLIEFYKENKKDVSYKLYPNGRHEMLNEPNKEEVYIDIEKFINEKIGENKR